MLTIQLSDAWRVRPLDHLQWVLERRAEAGGGRWKGRVHQLEHAGEVRERWLPHAYCRTKAGLKTALSRLKAEGIVLDPAPLAAFPLFFPEPKLTPDADLEPTLLETVE